MSEQIIAIVQARMGSTRFPGKVLQDLAGEPLLLRVAGRVARVPNVDRVVIATSDQSRDDPVASLCRAYGYVTFRGDEFDVLGRFCAAAEAYGADHILRVTADAPFFDVDLARATLGRHLQKGADYTHSITAFGSGYPAGVGSEAFTRAALIQSCHEATEPYHREHVDEYVHKHPQRFRIETLKAPAILRRPDLDLSVDAPEDLQRARDLYESLGADVRLLEVLRYIDAHD